MHLEQGAHDPADCKDTLRRVALAQVARHYETVAISELDLVRPKPGSKMNEATFKPRVVRQYAV
ncbi:hypothetical protein N185_17320 [Sinorhizobium sp. GW3]|nr:hypothetical protein N185_17320 [Sinorhizobium sp. GW3]